MSSILCCVTSYRLLYLCSVYTILQLQMLDPAVTGTTNVLKAASAANVQRVVVVSSIVAVEINPKDWPQGKIRDENCWSDIEFCRKIEVPIVLQISTARVLLLLPLIFHWQIWVLHFPSICYYRAGILLPRSYQKRRRLNMGGKLGSMW
jgi:hypothetical protein